MADVENSERVASPCVKTIASTLRNVLAQVDAARLPADIGAHIDLALCRIDEIQDSETSDPTRD